MMNSLFDVVESMSESELDRIVLEWKPMIDGPCMQKDCDTNLVYRLVMKQKDIVELKRTALQHKGKLMTLHGGWDSFTPAPGMQDKMSCRVCDEDMEVERNINGPTGMAEAMGKGKHLHDHFSCKHANQDWHSQILALKKEQQETASTTIRDILEGE